MKFFQNFFISFSKSLYDIHWLKTRRDDPKKAWTYFFTFMFFFIIFVSLVAMWEIPKELKGLWQEAKKDIPEFEAVIDEGQLSVTGLDQPFTFEYTSDEGEEVHVYLDTISQESINVEDFFKSDAEINAVITKDKMAFHNDAETRIIHFTEMKNDEPVRFSRSSIIEQIEGFTKAIFPFVLPLVIIVLLIFWSIGKLIFLFFISIFAWIISMFSKEKWTFEQIYYVGLYAITLPTIAIWLLAAFDLSFIFAYSLIFLILMSLVFFAGKEKIEEK